jgi:hypothetical protein
MAPAPVPALAVSAAVLVIAALGGAVASLRGTLAPVVLGLAAMAAASAVAPAVTVAVMERLAAGIAPHGRLDRLGAAEKALEPRKETLGGRLRGGSALGAG